MKRALLITLFCCAIETLVLAQQTASTRVPGTTPPPDETAASGTVDIPPTSKVEKMPAEATEEVPVVNADTTAPSTLGKTPAVEADTQGARELPLDSEAFDVRVHRRVVEYHQRHQDRTRRRSAYEKASVGDPGLERFADPRKVQVELSDELDREQTSEELSADYMEQAHDVQSKEQALQEFISKRRQSLDELNKHNGATHRQDLEVALANLARQPESPETLAEIREIDRRLSEAERTDKDLPSQLSQNQQEAADAQEELAKLQTLQQAYVKEAKTFTADALSARQNRLRLASKLEYFVVRAQAEDSLEQGRKALETVEHLPPSSDIENLLKGPGSSTRSDSDLQKLRDCIRESGDVKACRQSISQE